MKTSYFLIGSYWYFDGIYRNKFVINDVSIKKYHHNYFTKRPIIINKWFQAVKTSKILISIPQYSKFQQFMLHFLLMLESWGTQTKSSNKSIVMSIIRCCISTIDISCIIFMFLQIIYIFVWIFLLAKNIFSSSFWIKF